MRNNCIFCAIIDGEIPSTKVYEDEQCLIFKDINPKAKIHLVAIPKYHHAHIDELNPDEAICLASILSKISKMQEKLGLSNGYRIIINQGSDANQTVGHLHIHLLGGEKLED